MRKGKLMRLERENTISRSHILEGVNDVEHSGAGMVLSVVCWEVFSSLAVYLNMNSFMRVFLQGKRRLK